MRRQGSGRPGDEHGGPLRRAGIGLGQQSFGIEAGTDELVEVVDHPAPEHVAVRFGVELQTEVRPGPEHLGARGAPSELGGAGRDGEGVEVPLQPRSGFDAGVDPGRVHLDGQPSDLGMLGPSDGPAERDGQDLAAEAEPEHRDPGVVGGAEELDLGLDPVGDLRVVDRPSGSEQHDLVVVVRGGKGRGTRRAAGVRAHLVDGDLRAERGERAADMTVTGVRVVVDEQDPHATTVARPLERSSSAAGEPRQR